MQCKECKAELEEKSKFCMKCGTPVEIEIEEIEKPYVIDLVKKKKQENHENQESDSGTRGEQHKEEQDRTKFFYGKAKYLKDTVRVIERFLDSKNLITQIIDSEIGVIIHGQTKPNFFKKWTGLNEEVTIQISVDNDDLKLATGDAEWMGKIAAALVGLFVFATTLFTAGWGAYQQQKLFTEIETEVAEFLKTKP
jgi:hypothetical protein